LSNARQPQNTSVALLQQAEKHPTKNQQNNQQRGGQILYSRTQISGESLVSFGQPQKLLGLCIHRWVVSLPIAKRAVKLKGA